MADAGLSKLKYSGKRRKGQEGVKRLHIHEPGCDICAQTDPSHRSMSGGSALGVQNEKNGGFEKRSAEEMKLICAIYDEEASAEPSTSDHFLVFKQTCKSLTHSGPTYAEKQRRVVIYTGEQYSGRRTLEQYLEALMYLIPETI
ncbi:hypothetical protein T02_3202 [Trichinella nativa]|uniref:Uncharacterized protein n=1 Tax=Trichinella nativa TaxID=6335 RepID=A0A0V1KZ61_9BILA|nr:hypothetical protein T02_3202 [Trichinella nativa]